MIHRENSKIKKIHEKVKQPNGIVKLTLTNFRNYKELRLVLDSRSLVITGDNGAGKTNILEAISLLARGSGLRNSKLSEIGSRDVDEEHGDSWAVAASLKYGNEITNLGTSYDPLSNEKRKANINGQGGISLSHFAEHIGVLWLTPQMDNLFIESPSDRRKFLDRMVSVIDPGHAGRCAAFDRANRQRMKLFRDGMYDEKWHEALEDVLCRYGVSISAARIDFLNRMNKSICQYQGPFPIPTLSMVGEIDTLLADRPAIEAEELFRENLEEKRLNVSKKGDLPATEGPNRSDLKVVMKDKGRVASECSTGEQKALLVSIILANLSLLPFKKNITRILLLDEVVAHLDEGRRSFLFDRLFQTNTQVWITGTDKNIFSSLGDKVQYFTVDKSMISLSLS